MSIRKHANNYTTTLNGAIDDSVTTLVVTSATGLPAIGSGEEFNLTLYSGNLYEIVRVTDDSSSPSFTVVRGAEGSTNQAWGNGAKIRLAATADSLDRKRDINEPVEAFASDMAITTTSGVKILSKTSAGAYTLAANATDGVTLKISSSTDFAHMITATSLILDGVTGVPHTTATFAAFAGASLVLVSYSSKWQVLSNNGVVIS